MFNAIFDVDNIACARWQSNVLMCWRRGVGYGYCPPSSVAAADRGGNDGVRGDDRAADGGAAPAALAGFAAAALAAARFAATNAAADGAAAASPVAPSVAAAC